MTKARSALPWLLLACVGCAAAPEARSVFDVPALAGIAIDGKADDWLGGGFRVAALSWPDGPVKPAKDLDPRFALGWDDRGLLVLVTVADDVPVETPDDTRLWANDCVELFLADRRGGSEKIQCLVAPGRDPRHPKLRQHLLDQRRSGKLKQAEPIARAARTKTPGGYVMEVLLPWSNVGVEPAPGREVAFQIYVNDADAPGRVQHAAWYPALNAHADSTQMHRLRLASKASEPVLATAAGHYEHFRRVVVNVSAAAELVGEPVTVRHAGRTLARGALARRAGRAAARLHAPMPPRGRPYGTLGVLIGNRAAAAVELPDPDRQRARALLDSAGLACRPHVFSGRALPPCEFLDPALAEGLLGPHELDATYYDKDYNQVTSAETPGRYGAVITARAEDGRTVTRFATLFRAPGGLNWRRAELTGAVELPKALGIDPAVAAERAESINEVLKTSLAEQAARTDAAARLLAGLHETKPGGVPATVFNSPESLDRQWWVGLKRKLNGNDKRFAQPIACPVPIAGQPATVLRKGTLAEAGMKAGADEQLDALLTKWAGDSDQGFIACVARRGVIVLHKAYGTRDGKPMGVHTKSWMASLTKLMHGACLMMLVDRGLVGLDEPVGEYLPALRGVAAAKGMTVRHLITHTAGMWGHWGDERNDFEHLIAEYGPYLEIGKKHQYNGMSLALGSKVIEQVSGEALPAFYKKHLLDPLGCADTEVTNASYDAQSTAMDMARIGQMLLNGGAYGRKRFFRRETRDRMLPVRLTMVLGPATKVRWGIGCTWMSTDVFGERTFGHGSAASATLRIDLANDLVVSMTRNTAGRNFGKYHPRFLKLIADSMIDAAKRPAK